MAKCKACRGIGTIFTPRVITCDQCSGTGGSMDLEWATEIIQGFQEVRDRANEEARGDISAIIGGYNDLEEWTEGLFRAGRFLLEWIEVDHGEDA
jgi:RecJ-like exonuclease